MISLTSQEIQSLAARGIIGFVKSKSPSKKALNMRRYRRENSEHYRELNRRHSKEWRAAHPGLNAKRCREYRLRP